MESIEHVFTDLDGTLLNDAGEITAYTQAVLKNCPLPISLVSARSPQAMQPLIAQLDLKAEQVAFNGALIFDEKGLLKKFPLPLSLTDRLVREIKNRYPQVNLSYFTAQDWYIEQMDERIVQEMQFTPQIPKKVDLLAHLQDLAKNETEEIFKLLLILPDDSHLEEVKQDLEALNLTEIVIQKTWTSYLEITLKSAQKSKAIAWIAQQKGLKNTALAAFGDNENDLSMLRSVGLPIAVANASLAVKKVSHYMTSSNNEDGVAQGLQKYILRET